MNDVNKIILIGRLVRDPEFKTVTGFSLVNFSIVNNQKTKQKEEVNFFDCQAWGKLADIIRQYCKKGKQVAIEGRLQQSVWDGQDGKKNSKIRIVVENLQLLGGNENSSNKSKPDQSDKPKPNQSYESHPAQSNMDNECVF